MRKYLSKKIIGLLYFVLMLTLNGAVFADVAGSLIPFYIYPTPIAIQPLLDAKQQHPNIPMRVILDPDSGPGTTQDPVYVEAIKAMQLAGIQVVGYVNTDYNKRPIKEVISDITEWQTLYQPDGIFLDRMGTDLDYYVSLTKYIKSSGMQFSIGNAQENVYTSYTKAVDTVVIANGSTLPNLANYSNWQQAYLPKSSAAMFINSIKSFPTGFIYEAKKFVGWIYVTDVSGEQPWCSLPSYLSLVMSALDTVNTGTIFPFYIYPTQEAIQPLIDTANQYPNVPIWVLLNPATGPGKTIDPNYVNAVTQLRAAGINILGYVNTNYGKRPINNVESDIKKWINFYKPDGIFLDLMAVDHPYYSSITAFAKKRGIQMVEGNPGININSSAGNDVDIVNIFENDFLPTPLTQFKNWNNKHPASNLSLICYNISPLPTTFISQAVLFFGWIFITDDNMPDPYNTYPSYFNSFIQQLSEL